MIKKIFTLIICFTFLFLKSNAQPPSYALQAVQGIYTPVAGGTVAVIASGNIDDGFSNGIPIGFTFTYNGVNYTTISASANGWSALGANITVTSSTTNLTSAANRPKLAPFYEDLALTDNANLTYQTSGTTGSRIFTLEWSNMLWDFNASAPSLSFQVKLYEGTNIIEFTYKQESGEVQINNSGGASIGISTTATGSGSFLSLSDSGPNPAVSSTIETTNISARPSTGQIYRWIPYCSASATNTTGEKISNFTYNTIDNNSSSTAGYENFSSQLTTVYLFPNSTLPFSTFISSFQPTDKISIYIDFNHNGDFSDPGESVFTSTGTLTSGTVTGNITIPAISSTVLSGRTRLRVRLEDTNNGPIGTSCGSSTTGQVEDYSIDIQQCFSANFSSQPQNIFICNGGSGSISMLSSGTLLTYQWQVSTNGGVSFNDLADNATYSGVTTNTLNISGATLLMNDYKYRVSINGTCTPTNTFSNVATLTINTAAAITLNPTDKKICVGQSTSFTSASTGSSVANQWQVSTDGGFSFVDLAGQTNTTLNFTNVHQILNGNRYRMKATVVSCGSVYSTPAILTVNALPVVTISVDPINQVKPGTTTFITAGSVPAPASYVWRLNGTVIPGATARYLIANVDGIGKYNVSVTDSNGCTGTSPELDISGLLSDKAFIYPNPNDGQFTVRFYSASANTKYTVTITNMLGNLVSKKYFTTSGSNYYPLSFDLRGVATGIYALHIFNETNNTEAKGKIYIKR